MLDTQVANAILETASYSGKTLVERVTGRFYTPDVLGAHLAYSTTQGLTKRRRTDSSTRILSVCDPFCGDGRLIVELLTAIAQNLSLRRRKIAATLRDVDPAAVKVARRNVASAAARLGLRVAVHTEIGDSLLNSTPITHDIVVTNPPWELLKPDVRETAKLNKTEAHAFRSWLKSRCAELDNRFPDAKADVAWAGWGTNLARCGWDLALRSCAQDGVLGIVLPSTILADQASVSMRRAAMRRGRLIELAAYPPEARLFARVDQPVVAATFVMQKANAGLDTTLRLFGSDRTEKAVCRIRMSQEELVDAEFALPVGFGAAASELLRLFSGLPKFRDLEGPGPSSLWAGRELDETGLNAKLRPSRRRPFVKGRMVRRHGLAELPCQSVHPLLASGFRSTAFERLVWRDVSRSSQRRRMIGTVIPAGWVAGNSLHVAHFRDGDPERLRALYGVVSSFAFEYQVRCRLATGHMSLGIVRQARIPEMTKPQVRAISIAAGRVLTNSTPETDAALEVQVAKAYGINRESFAAVLDQFVKLDSTERDLLLRRSSWRSSRA